MSDPDPLADLRGHHPTRINLDAIEARAVTPEEREAIIQAARSARDNRELFLSILRTLPDLLKILA
jgi:hypothetical protein